MSDATYQPLVYRKQGGSEMVVASGGALTVESGGTFTNGGTFSQTGTTTAASGSHFLLNTTSDDKQVRINSRNFSQTSGSSIGLQVKPAQAASSSGNVIGGEISPRLNDGIALTGTGTIIGLHVDAYLKGTTGNVAGDVRGLQVELVDDAGSTRTVAGDEAGIRIRNATEHTVTGQTVAIRVDSAEKSNKWDAFAKVAAEAGLAAKHTNAGAALPGDVGWIRVRIGDTYYKLPAYND